MEACYAPILSHGDVIAVEIDPILCGYECVWVGGLLLRLRV
jgi:hypothetical protein